MAPEGQSLLNLLQLIPDVPALSVLREALIAASMEDETRRWARSRAYTTLDARVLAPDAIEPLVAAVAAQERERVHRVITDVGRALRQGADGDTEAAMGTLVELGESHLDAADYDAAAAAFEAVVRNAATARDRRVEGAALRGLAKSCWRRGDLEGAYALYQRSRHIAGEQGDRSLEIVACQGLGNVRAAQGRLEEAEALYREGLALCREEDRLARAQLVNNLSQVARRRGRLEEAGRWQEEAEALLEAVDAPGDRLVALNNRGLLHLAAGELDQARSTFLRGLEMAREHLARSALLVNLAQAELHEGALERAEGLARDAEQAALLSGATELLIEAYTVLGIVRRERGDDLGITFFEKALQLAADGRYPLELARVHVEYGRLRHRTGDRDEASAHFDSARDIFLKLGAQAQLDMLEESLDGLRASGSPADG